MHPTEFLSRKLAALPNRLQVAFAAGCAEHVLPLFELCARSERPRKALEVAWRYALGENVSFEELRLAADSAASVIPNLDEDQSDEAELSRSAAVAVLETLDAVKDGVAAPAVRAAAGALSALSIAAQILDAQLDEIVGDVEDLPENSNAPPDCVKEWKLQKAMLEQLAEEGPTAVDSRWREIQRERGVEVGNGWKTAR